MNPVSLSPARRRKLSMLALMRAKTKLAKIVQIGTDVYNERELIGFREMLTYVSEQYKIMRKNPEMKSVSILSICHSFPVSNALAQAGIRDVADILDFSSFEVRKIMGRCGRKVTRSVIIALLYDY